jgi:ATP-dependent Lon protease
VQLRSFDAGKSGADLGIPALTAFCSALLNRPLKGGLAVIGGLNLGGSIETVHNALDLVELAIEKGATSVLMPVSCRRALIDLSDEAAAKVQTVFYLDPGDALRKALHDG